MDKLEIQSPTDILPELKIILSKLKSGKDMAFSSEKLLIHEATGRLKQLLNLIECSGRKN